MQLLNGVEASLILTARMLAGVTAHLLRQRQRARWGGEAGAGLLQGVGPGEGGRSPAAAFNLDFCLLASGTRAKPGQMGVLIVTTPPPPPRSLSPSRTDVAGCPRGPCLAAHEGRQGSTGSFTLPARPPWAPWRPPLGLAPLGPERPGQLRVSPRESPGTKASLCSAGWGASSLQLVRPSGLSTALSPRPQAGLPRGAPGKGRRRRWGWGEI